MPFIKDESLRTDYITGFYARTYFETKLVKRINKKIKKKKATVIFGDYNFLKYSNELYGYSDVDEAIRIISSLIKQSFVNFKDCYIIRYGGDEICVIVFNETSKILESIIKSIKNSIELIPIEDRKNLSIALGMAKKIAGESIEDVIIRAQDAMKKDKAKMQHGYDFEIETAVEILLPTIKRLVHVNDYGKFIEILNNHLK